MVARRLKPSRATAVLKSNLIRSIEFGSDGSTTFETGLILRLQHNMYATLPGAYQEIHLLECTVKHNKALEPPPPPILKTRNQISRVWYLRNMSQTNVISVFLIMSV